MPHDAFATWLLTHDVRGGHVALALVTLAALVYGAFAVRDHLRARRAS